MRRPVTTVLRCVCKPAIPASFSSAAFQHAHGHYLPLSRPICYAVSRHFYLFSAFCTHQTLFRCMHTHATLHNVADLYTTCRHLHMPHDISCTTMRTHMPAASGHFIHNYCTLNTHDRITHAHHSSVPTCIDRTSISSHTSPFG